MAIELADTPKTDDKAAELERLIEEERQRFDVPGVAVAVVHRGRVVLSRGFGQRDLAKGLPVTDQTLFAIGSSTKAFTASLVGALVDDGLLEWDRPVRHYLPRLRMHDPVVTEHLTVRDMLSHRSGLPRHDLVWYGNTTLTRADVVTRMEHLQPNKTLRELWQYNNLMYLLAGYLAGELMGCTWEEAVRHRLLEPLGMDSTNMSVVEQALSPDHSAGYARKNGELVDVPFRDAGATGPAGSINSSVADMTKWVLAQLQGGVVDGKQVISPAALKQLHAPTMVLPEGAVGELWPEATNTAYALGWFVMNYRGHKVLHHGGNIDGFAAMVSMLPAEGIGVVALTNLHPTGLRDVIPYTVFDTLLGMPALPWGDRYREMYEAMFGGIKAAAEHKKTRATAAPPSHAVPEYAGRYQHPGYGEVTITLDDGKLVPHYNELDLSMEHVHYDTWGLQLPLAEAPPLDMSFETATDGRISALRIPMELSVEPIVFARQPDTQLSDPAVLRRYTGRYGMGPLRLNVEVDARDTLIAEVVGQGRVALVPKGERSFAVPEQPTLSFEFVLDDAGAVTQVVVDPAGIFLPLPDAS
jgi:CubicO group peptidase (beta-lactamase class C family)